jgi:hypothetical protein
MTRRFTIVQGETDDRDMTDHAPIVDPDMFAQWQAQSRRIDEMAVVFIVGPPKTGTTWVMQCLEGHPNAVVRGESSICRALFPGLMNSFQQYNQHQDAYHASAVTKFGERDFQFILRQIMDRQLVQYLADSNRSSDEPVLAVMDKSPQHSQYIHMLARLYPKAKFICCLRDVRDGAVSAWFHFSPQGWLKQKNIYDYARVYAAHTWGAMIRDARSAGLHLGPDRYVEVEYADHKADPTGVMRELLRFIGLPATDEHVRLCVAAGDFRSYSGGRACGEEDCASFYRKGVVGDWTNHFSEEYGRELLELAEAVVNDQAPPAAVSTT